MEHDKTIQETWAKEQALLLELSGKMSKGDYESFNKLRSFLQNEMKTLRIPENDTERIIFERRLKGGSIDFGAIFGATCFVSSLEDFVELDREGTGNEYIPKTELAKENWELTIVALGTYLNMGLQKKSEDLGYHWAEASKGLFFFISEVRKLRKLEDGNFTPSLWQKI